MNLPHNNIEGAANDAAKADPTHLSQYHPNVMPIPPVLLPEEMVDFAQSPTSGQYSAQPPGISRWKTSVGFTILGFVCTLIVNRMVLGSMANSMSLAVNIAALLINLVWIVLSIIYALKIYPSLFGERPALKSSKTISFFNGFIGYFFGLFWNSSLTKRRKGISQYVFSALLTIGTVSSLLIYWIIPMQGIQEQSVISNTAVPSASTPSFQPDSKAVMYISTEDGFGISFPHPNPTVNTETSVYWGYEVPLTSYIDAGTDSYYQVGVAKFPPELTTSETWNARSALGGSIGGMTNENSELVESENESTTDGHPSASATYLASDSEGFVGTMYVKAVLKDDTLYLMMIIGTSQDEADRFFSSFKLL